MRNGLARWFDLGSGLVEFGNDRVQGAGHVGPGVAVGHWVHIEAIDSGRMGLDSISERNNRTTKPIGIEMFG
jgi:hypothetical protein